MEELNFSEGIHTNTKPVNTPNGYYRDAENMRLSGGARKTEEGNIQMTSVPSNIVVWGNCSIGDKTVVLGTINSKSIIGWLDRDDVWTMKVPARAGVDVLGITGPTQVEGKRNWAGEEVIYFATPSGARRINLTQTLPTDDIEFDKVTSLFLEYDLPKVTYTGETGGGRVPSGAYQIAARLVTESGASTPFGIISNVISVVPSSLNASRNTIVGAAPQTDTSKAVTLDITNIDTAFKYIELGVLTYVGLGNVPVVNVTNQIAINDQSEITYSYRGDDDHADTITINEFITSGIAYLTGKFLAQKDGVLLMAAPEEAAYPDIDWYRVAAGITAGFVIKKYPYREDLHFVTGPEWNGDELEGDLKEVSTTPVDDTYVNPLTAYNDKGYRRDEVYALTFTPVFTSGVHGPTVHIPANNDAPTDALNASGNPDDGGTLGTYISGEKYQEDDYPGIDAADGLRLHKMPSVVDQPIVDGNVENGNLNIRILGIKLSNIVLHADELQYADQIAGFIIGRVDRRGNETQLAQGIVRSHIDVHFARDDNHSRGTLLGDGFCGWLHETRDDTADQRGKSVDGTASLTSFNFVAPDIIHGLYNENSASHIKQHAAYTADPYAIPDRNTTEKPPRTGYAEVRAFFKNILGESSQVLDRTETELDGNGILVGPFGVPLASSTRGGKIETGFIKGSETINMCSSDGFLWLSTLGGIPIKYHKDYETLYKSRQYLSDGTNAFQRMEYLYPIGTRVDFVVHTLTRQNAKQYGPLTQMTSMFTHYQEWDGFAGELEFFNGDTFISKYGLTLNDEAHYPWTTDDQAGEAGSGTRYIGYSKPPNAGGVVYFWLESDNNYNYRHFEPTESYNETNVDAEGGTVPFFPAYKQLVNWKPPFGILSMHAENWIRPGYANQYNNQYSTQPTAKPYAVTPREDIERKSALQNRIIYSASAIQGEKSDGYQIFLPNNYYDVPQEYGELTDLYVNGELFTSTEQVQWKLFFNTLATQATSAGEVVLGTGGAFNRPAVPMTTVDGGFGGTSHWLHAINTVYGRIFVDKVQGKFFMLTDKLITITGDLDDAHRLYVQKLTDDQILVGSEPLRERAFIKVGDTMWSYNLDTKKFISRHTFVPRWFFSHGPYMYTNQASLPVGLTGIFKHSIGETGNYYGQVHEASITLVMNKGNTISKLFRNLELLTKRSTEAGLTIPFETFNELIVWNDERYSGTLTIVPNQSVFQRAGVLEVLTRRVQDSFRMVVPRDVVIDPSSDITNVLNHNEKPGDTELAPMLPKMRGTYIEIKLIADNKNGPTYLFDAKVGLAENIR